MKKELVPARISHAFSAAACEISGLVLLLTVVAVPVSASVGLADTWARTRQELRAGNLKEIQQGVEELRTMASETGVRRLTPYASALVMWASTHPESDRREIVRLARTLDRDLPSARFLAARLDWGQGRYVSAVREYLVGWWAVGRDSGSRWQLLLTLGPWWFLALGAAAIIGCVLGAVRFLPLMAHDGFELGLLFFGRGNAVVFAVVVLALPLFAGLGPAWVVGWLFALSWGYLGSSDRLVAAVVWLAAVLTVPAMGWWQTAGLRERPVLRRAAAMLEERRLDPSTLQELANLESRIGSSESYHLVLGELFRMHADPISARIQFQRAALAADSDPRPLVFLGNLALKEGNIPAAIESYGSAIERDPAFTLAYYDLSFAYDLGYRFREADNVRRKAEALGIAEVLERSGAKPSAGAVNPPLEKAVVTRILDEVSGRDQGDPELSAPRVDVVKQLLNPLPLAFLATGGIGLILLVVRKRWMWVARACSRCGKVFCPKCKSATESEAYCSQCISVFLKRDVVAIEQQAVKLDQIRRWEWRTDVLRRAVSIVIPGGGVALAGRWALGVGVLTVAAACAFGLWFWIPFLLHEVIPEGSVLPLQAVLAAGLAVSWLGSIVNSWNRW